MSTKTSTETVGASGCGGFGGPGGFTAVRVRGAEGEQLLVLIDGVRMADVASPGGGFDFGNLLMGNFGHIELQRSSNSTIWGSQALGGVLLATIGHDQDVWGNAEYGGDDTLYATAGINLDVGLASFQLQGGRFDSEGFSSAAAGTEKDGFRQTEVAGRFTLNFTPELSAFAAGRYADGRLDIDGFPAPSFALADTVRATYYVTDRADADAVLEVAGRHFGGIRPAATLLVVAGLLKAEMKVEIEVTAKRRG